MFQLSQKEGVDGNASYMNEPAAGSKKGDKWQTNSKQCWYTLLPKDDHTWSSHPNVSLPPSCWHKVWSTLGHFMGCVRNEEAGRSLGKTQKRALYFLHLFLFIYSSFILQSTYICTYACHTCLCAAQHSPTELISPHFILGAPHWNTEHVLEQSRTDVDPYHSPFLAPPSIHKPVLEHVPAFTFRLN